MHISLVNSIGLPPSVCSSYICTVSNLLQNPVSLLCHGDQVDFFAEVFSRWLASRDTLDLWPFCGHFKRAAFRAVYSARPDVLLEEITCFNPLFSSDFIFQDSIFWATLTKALSSIRLWFATQTRFNLCCFFFEEVTSSFLALFLQLAV